MSLERRLIELRETLEMVRDGFLHKSADVELLQKKASDQVRQQMVEVTSTVCQTLKISFFLMKAKSLEGVLEQNAAKDGEIASLKAELARRSQKSTAETKAKRGLLANIKEAVTSPRKGRKAVRTPHH